MNILAVIPARYASQRLPGKPLAKLGNKPMVQWVYEAARGCPEFTKVVVATDDERIANCVQQFDGDVEMTRCDHETGTDRVAEVAQRYPHMDVVVNVQGDQPFVTSDMLTTLISPYWQGEWPDMTTLACPLEQSAESVDPSDPNVVKVVCNQKGYALYFSRSSIPYYRNRVTAPVFHHLGLYAFRSNFLLTYTQLAQTPLEKCEALEQLRVLEHGFSIKVCFTPTAVLEVNTGDDLKKAQALL